MSIQCNICGSFKFQDFGLELRTQAQCANCLSLERHRALHIILKSSGLFSNDYEGKRCLHLAPEKCTHDYLIKVFKSGYVSADLSPEKYEHTKCLKLNLSEGFDNFQDNHFDLIIHNHVLEHIPGNYKTHIDTLYRILSYNGAMVFTIPEINIRKGVEKTIEGGEFLTIEQRSQIYGDPDHFKIFGNDLILYLKQKFNKVDPFFITVDNEVRKNLHKYKAFGIIFYCVK